METYPKMIKLQEKRFMKQNTLTKEHFVSPIFSQNKKYWQSISAIQANSGPHCLAAWNHCKPSWWFSPRGVRSPLFYDQTKNVLGNNVPWHQTVHKTCETCQRAKRTYHGKPPPLQNLQVDDLFCRYHMDILGPLKTSEPDQYKYVLVVVESLSKNPECFPLKTKTASEIASTLYKNVFCRYGAPKTLVMDNSLEFKSEIIQNLCQYFAVKRTFSSYYRPQTNASCERFNSTLLASLRCYLDQRQELWQDYLDAILMAYRATNCTNSTSFSPFFVLYGRHMQLPTDQALNQSIYKTKGKEAEAYLAKLLPRLELIREVAKQNIERSQESSKQRFDQRAQEVPFKPGMLVWLHDPKTPPHLSPKLHPRFTGPYYITAPGGNNLTFYLRDTKTTNSLPNQSTLRDLNAVTITEKYSLQATHRYHLVT